MQKYRPDYARKINAEVENLFDEYFKDFPNRN